MQRWRARGARGVFPSHAGTIRPLRSQTPQPLLAAVGRSARLQVLDALKRSSSGLPVAELAAKLGMSYMGVKDLCKDLAAAGLLDTWRQPRGVGRPLMLYRLTPRAQELFPRASDSFTLELLQAAQSLFGAAAAEKLLHVCFQQKAVEYARKVSAVELSGRITQLVRLREAEGYMTECVEGEGGEPCIVEHHSPILDVLRAFPLLAKLEADLFQRVLQTRVTREEETVSGLYVARFHLHR